MRKTFGGKSWEFLSRILVGICNDFFSNFQKNYMKNLEKRREIERTLKKKRDNNQIKRENYGKMRENLNKER